MIPSSDKTTTTHVGFSEPPMAAISWSRDEESVQRLRTQIQGGNLSLDTTDNEFCCLSPTAHSACTIGHHEDKSRAAPKELCAILKLPIARPNFF